LDEAEAQQRARSFIAPLDLSSIRQDLRVYIRAANAILLVEEMGEGESGSTITRPDGKHVITINEAELLVRQRFTICHEIAHIVLGLPSSHSEVPQHSIAKRHINEIHCDTFASELLMPYTLWNAEVPRGQPSDEVIEQMAGAFQCSFPAAASRYATLAPVPCAFVTMEKGAVRYAARSTSLRRLRGWISPRSVIPEGSVARRLRDARRSATEVDSVSQDLWFDDWEKGEDLQEMARHYPVSDTTIALLWFEEDDAPAREFDRFGVRQVEDDGLPELSGELPWPGRSRRKG
jgi:Zn-dependent peptidase ImmA (M78 family)